MNETLTTLNTRRSIRRYRPEQVRPETLDAILEAGTYAPSAMGKQSAVMAVVQDPGDHRPALPPERGDPGPARHRPLLWRPHCGRGAG